MDQTICEDIKSYALRAEDVRTVVEHNKCAFCVRMLYKNEALVAVNAMLGKDGYKITAGFHICGESVLLKNLNEKITGSWGRSVDSSICFVVSDDPGGVSKVATFVGTPYSVLVRSNDRDGGLTTFTIRDGEKTIGGGKTYRTGCLDFSLDAFIEHPDFLPFTESAIWSIHNEWLA
jgi:hypothetical protein